MGIGPNGTASALHSSNTALTQLWRSVRALVPLRPETQTETETTKKTEKTETTLRLELLLCSYRLETNEEPFRQLCSSLALLRLSFGCLGWKQFRLSINIYWHLFEFINNSEFKCCSLWITYSFADSIIDCHSVWKLFLQFAWIFRFFDSGNDFTHELNTKCFGSEKE